MNKTIKDWPETYFQILSELANEKTNQTYQIAEKLSIPESSIAFKNLDDMNFVSWNRTNGMIEIASMGLLAYLYINSQKQSAMHANKALQRSTIAIVISGALLLVSIIFNILNLIY